MADSPDFYNPIYYSIIKRPFFRFDFPGLAELQVNYSQLHQDMFVLCVLAGKREGVYLDIGACEPLFISNTFLLEQHFDWRGIGFVRDEAMVSRHQRLRRNPCLHANAPAADYEACMQEAKLPAFIDYLSLKLGTGVNSLAALKRLPHDRYRFRVITFEHNLSRGGAKERAESRAFLEKLGYKQLLGDVSWGNHVAEDWWIDPKHTDPEIIQSLTPEAGPGPHQHDAYFYTALHFPAATEEPTIKVNAIHADRKGEGICVEGWRSLGHSYSLVNQWQLLELLRHPIKLRHHDVQPLNPAWKQTSFSVLPEDLCQRIEQIPPPDGEDYFSAIYRIAFPLNLLDGSAERIFVYGTSEFKYCPPEMFAGCTPAEASRRGNLAIVTPSQWSKTGFITAGFPEDQILVLPHGIPTQCLFPVEPELRSLYRQLFGFQDDDLVLLNLGALTPNKGVDLLLLAYANLKPTYPQLKLVIKDQSNLYGRHMQDVLKDMAESGHPLSMSEEHWNDVITLSDTLDMAGLRALYNASDVYVAPYRGEGYNLPPLEAAACGLPIVVTAGGSTDDYFDPGLGLQIASESVQVGPGTLLEPNLEALQVAIETMVHNPHRWGGAAGSAMVHTRFGWEPIGQRLYTLLSTRP